ncbi:hypothetical protein ACFSKN_07930 [Mariniflexile gromovii]|uniref:Uncharacterized protein n=1 Tax=Mariniflexile gromovii TaxID=362523 RepID=A0ABS4BQS6_9FLAO|nr:hypothetical protein [Mariniflexile gromovii]MBP0902933.1 hypothetical protein [Mariniflexile gromovii]
MKLEAKIPDIMQYFEEQAMQERANDIERELRRAEQQRQQQIEEEIKQIRKNEIEKFNQLLENSTRYRKAEELRAFITAKRENALRNNNLDASLENWIEWANAKADWLDPIISKKDESLGEYDDYK